MEELIKGLLNKNVNLRMTSLEKIKKLNIFAGFDWLKLSMFQITPPFIPDSPPIKDFLGNTESLYVDRLTKVVF